MRRIAVAVVCLALVASACGEDGSLTSPAPQPGRIVVSLDVLGEDVAMTGWRLELDSISGSPLHPDSTITVGGLDGGQHELYVVSEASNCGVMDENPRIVTVPTGETVQTRFEAACSALTGDLEVATATSGADPDPDGYEVRVDGGSPRTFVVDESVSFPDLDIGDHVIQIGDLASNCSVAGQNPRIVNVPSGGTAETTFEVACTELTGDLEVTVATGGANPDPDGYEIRIDGGSPRAVATDGTASFPDLRIGNHVIEIRDVAPNCLVAGQNPRTMEVTTGETARTTFDVTCSALTGDLEVTVTTGGADPDPDGYEIRVDGGSPRTVAADGTASFPDLSIGNHVIEIGDVEPNCSVADQNPRTVNVTADETARTTFQVTCVSLTGRLEVTAATGGSATDPDGYQVRVDGGPEWSVGTNGSVTITDLNVGARQVRLVDVAGNCVVEGANPRGMNVPSGGIVRTTFSVTCALPAGVERIMPTRPFAGSAVSLQDAESLAYVPAYDALWIADDNSDAVYQMDRSTGAYRSKIRAATIVSAAPSAGECDDGDGDPNTYCSYTEEFETLAYDLTTGSLYLINTVNNPFLSPPVDKPAIFRLVPQGSGFGLASWHELPAGFAYSAAVVIDGRLYVADGGIIAEYDFVNQRFASVDSNGFPIPVFSVGAGVLGLAHDDDSLWVLTSTQELLELDSATGAVVETRSLGGFGISRAVGLEVVDVESEVLIADGDYPNWIYVFSE